MEYKRSIQIEIKEIGPKGEFAGWGAISEIEDDGGDTIRNGSMKKSLRKRTPKIYLGHETSVGVYEVAEEKDNGLWVEGFPDESRDGLDAREKIKSRALDSLSIGFRTVKAKETGRFKRDLLEIDIFHVGIVAFGMHDQAIITSVKALDVEGFSTIREFERALRDAGFSRKAAEIACAPGFIAKLTQGEPDEDTAELVEVFKASASHLRQRTGGHENVRSPSDQGVARTVPG